MNFQQSNNLMSSNPKLLKKESNNNISWLLTERQICDIELLLNGDVSQGAEPRL